MEPVSKDLQAAGTVPKRGKPTSRIERSHHIPKQQPGVTLDTPGLKVPIHRETKVLEKPMDTEPSLLGLRVVPWILSGNTLETIQYRWVADGYPYNGKLHLWSHGEVMLT